MATSELDPKAALQNLVNVYEAQTGLRPAQVRLVDQSIGVLAKLVAPEMFEKDTAMQDALEVLDAKATDASENGKEPHVDVAVD